MIKLLADECVNTDVVLGLRKEGLDVLTVREASLTGTDDERIFKFAVENKRVLFSFDRGFGDIFRFNIKRSSGVMIVLVGQMRKGDIVKIVLGFLAVLGKRASLRGKLAILGKTRIRVIRR